jgi:uncharacterized membrane protein YidH (DUF202 family)
LEVSHGSNAGTAGSEYRREMAGAGILIIAIGVTALAYLIAGRRRLREETRYRRTLPVIGELPLGVYVGVQVVGCLLCIGLGIWSIAAG